MAEIKAHEFASLTRGGRVSYPIALIFGPDRGLVAERGAEIAKNSGVDLKDDFSVVRMDASELSGDPGRLIDEANSVSLFGGDRLIWIRNAGAEKGLVDALKVLAGTDLPATRIVIEAGDLKKSSPLRKLVADTKTAVGVPCYADDPRAVQALIDEELKTAELTITSDARARLTSMLGGDRLASRGELRKLALYCHGNGQVTEEDVIAAIGDVASLSVDDAVDAVLGGDLRKLDLALDRIEKSKLSVFLVLRGLMSQFLLMDLMRAEMENDGRQLSAVMQGRGRGIHFKRKPIFEKALRNWSLELIRKEIKRFEDAIFETRNKPAIEFALARIALMRTCLISARLSGGPRFMRG